MNFLKQELKLWKEAFKSTFILKPKNKRGAVLETLVYVLVVILIYFLTIKIAFYPFILQTKDVLCR